MLCFFWGSLVWHSKTVLTDLYQLKRLPVPYRFNLNEDMFLKFFFPDIFFRTNIILVSLLHHAFRSHFYCCSTNPKEDLCYLSAILHVPLYLVLCLHSFKLQLKYGRPYRSITLILVIAERMIKYSCGMRKQSIAIFYSG